VHHVTELTLDDLLAARTSNHWAECVASDLQWLWATADQCKDDPWRLAEIKHQLQHSVNKYTEPRLAKQLRFRETQLEIYLALLWAKPLGLRPTNAGEHASRFVGVDNLTLLNPTNKRRILDHAYYWRTGEGPLDGSTEFVITTHPYHAFDNYRRDAAEIARKVRAEVEFPDFPSRWNYDPRSRSEDKRSGTTLVVWRRHADAIVKIGNTFDL
jgi:hypothetical protein